MKYWWVVCCPPEKPDGPGEIFGPFPEHELALQDAGTDDCESGNHVVIRGEAPKDWQVSNTKEAYAALEHYRRHTEEWPGELYGAHSLLGWYIALMIRHDYLRWEAEKEQLLHETRHGVRVGEVGTAAGGAPG